MRVIKTILFTCLVVAGMALAIVNMETVRFVYLPDWSFMPIPEGASIELPLSIVVLAAVVLGTLIAGASSLIEHLRLRTGLRKQTKRNDLLQKELEQVRGEFEEARHRAEEGEARADEARAKAETAEKGLAEAETRVSEAEEKATGATARADAAEARATGESAGTA